MTKLDVGFAMLCLASRLFICVMLFGGQLDIGSARLGCSVPLGMQYGKIKNSQILAKTWDSGWEPYNGRLYNDRAWCSKDEEKEQEYFQVDLKKVRHVSAIGTQGTKTHFGLYIYYVKTYKIKYSFDGRTWYWYQVWDSSTGDYTAVKTFTGNSDDVDKEQKSTYRDSFVSRFIRLYPIDFEKDMCIRAEIYGCADEKDNCVSFLTTSIGNITSPNYPGNYSSGSDCTWIISVAADKHVTLFMRDFDVGASQNPGQCEDVLQIYNGPLDRSKLLGSYCNGLDLPTVVQSAGNTMRLHFLSKANTIPHKGFRIQYLTTSGADDVHAATACEGSRVYLSCVWYSYTINILHVFYGSYPYSPACHGINVASSTCSSVSAALDIKAHCQHFKSCNITVDRARFGQPCGQGVIPELQIYYQCTSTTIKNRTVTEEPSVLVSSTVTLVTATIPSENNTAGGGGNEAAREGDYGQHVVVIVAAVLSTLAVLAAVLVVVCFMYQRRRKRQQPSSLEVKFTPGKTREDSLSDRTRMYDSLNLLYQSGEQDKASATEPIYETADVNSKVSENLLYESADQAPSECNDYHEPLCVVPKQNGSYEEPVGVPGRTPPKGISVSNPGYGRTIELNQVPQYEKNGP